MIYVKDHFIYLATQGTGSRSVTRALLDYCGGEKLSPEHHATLSDMEKLKDYDVPVVAFIRDPYDWILTRYYYTHRNPSATPRPYQTLEQWIPEYAAECRADKFGSILSKYRNYVDRYFLYEDGLEHFFETVGFPGINMPTEGALASYQIKNDLPEFQQLDDPQHIAELIDEHFWVDVYTYQRAKEISDAHRTN